MQPVIKPAAGLVEALTAVRATCKLAVSEGADWKARAIAAEANARTPGTVEVCRMLDCKWKHEYQWGDCEAANCPIRAKATQEPKI